MAHFAEIDENNKVVRVLVVDNSEEHRGQELLSEELGLGGTWVQTSYNGNIRYNFAGVGYTYDPIDDAFIAPMPDCKHDELALNDKKQWECSHASHVIIRDDS